MIEIDKIKELLKKYPNSSLIEYMDKIFKDEIIAGKELKQTLKKLLEHFEDDTIKIDFKDSDKRIKFIENECKHSEAPFAGKPFLLELHQKAFIEGIYIFKIYDAEIGKWVRKYQDVLYLVARKNGKTPLISAICLAEFFCGEAGTKILCSSNDYTQADLAFQAINNMREESPKLEKVTRKNIKGIYFGNPRKPKRKGKFSYQNKGNITKISAKTGAKEGRSIRVGIFDEVHELKDDRSIIPIRQSLATQENPLFIELTTEGYVDKGYLDTRLAEARKVLKGELERPRWLVWMYTQDNEEEVYQDEKTWLKANPNLGVSKKWSYLRGQMEEAKTNSATRAGMMAKDFNIKQGSTTAWLQLSDIINKETFKLADFAGCFYISGNDFAETTDLCSSTILLMKPNDSKKYLHTRYWIPESKLKDSPDDVDYEKWYREGWITIIPGNSVDTSVVADWHFKLLEEYDLKPYKSGYDNRFAKDFVRRYDEVFGEKIAINIPQDFKVLNNPMRTLEADMKDGLVNYQNNPVCKWCFLNTGIVLDKLGRIMPAKMDSKKRIDGTASKIDAYATLEWFKSEFMSLVG